jgi:hypothetical protein
MPSEPYQVFGPGVPLLLGRSEEWKRTMRRLEKSVPDNVSVVGPRYIGKTVLLSAIALHFGSNREHFDGCAYWNIGHNTPQTDAEFYRVFGQYASEAICIFDTVIGKELDSEGVDYERLSDAFAMLDEDSKKVLVIMDGFDHLKYNAQLSKNLWDSLRALAEGTSLRFLIGSQKPLREICATPEARTSPFWNLFADSTLNLGAFSKENDWEQILAPFNARSIELQSGARTELFNVSGGIPVLASALCKRVWDKVDDGGVVSNSYVTSLVDDFVERVRSTLDDLWEDCDAEEQGIAADLAQGRSFRAGDVSRDTLQKLKQRGFITQEKAELRVCRSIAQYVTAYKPQANDLRRLFGSTEDFQKNIRSVLELRVTQLDSTEAVDDQLIEYLRSAVQKVEKPYLVVNEIRGLVNRAFSVIWDRELPDRRIPPDWTAGWKMEDREGNRPEFNPPEGPIPNSGGKQCNLLRLMADPRKAGHTRVSRSTTVMLDYLQSVGDYGQHLDDTQVPDGFTYTVCFTAIELSEQLAIELALESPPNP